MAAGISAYPIASKKPAANGQTSAIFENIYCTRMKMK
jgi:hypothetical protein